MTTHAALTDNEAGNAWVKSQHVYTGRYGVYNGPEEVISWGNNKGKPRCCAAVHDRNARVGFFQCDKQGKEQTADDNKRWWCGTHGPTGVSKRNERVKAEDERKRQEVQNLRNRMALRNPHIIALLKIAKGDNNAIGTAKEALGEYWDLFKDTDLSDKY